MRIGGIVLLLIVYWAGAKTRAWPLNKLGIV